MIDSIKDVLNSLMIRVLKIFLLCGKNSFVNSGVEKF